MINMEKKYFLLGDIHGDFKPVRDLYQRHPFTFNKTDNTLILLGDAGLNFFFNHRDKEIKKKLGKYPFTYFVVRGNHEERPSICAEKNPDAWEQITEVNEHFVGTYWVEKEFPYIHYAMDYPSVYTINGYKTLVIPGAYSVDKWRRLQMGWSWFPKEQLTKEEMQIGLDLIEEHQNDFDLILSHTCPIIYEPTDLFLSCVDQSMVEKDMERYLGQIEYMTNYRGWCWGHYHKFRDYPRTDGSFRTMLFNDYALDLNEYMNGEINKL